MGPGYFVIAIMGCADGAAACVPVATLPNHYSTAAECRLETGAALAANNDFDFPTLLAQCRPGAAAEAAAQERERPLPAAARRG